MVISIIKLGFSIYLLFMFLFTFVLISFCLVGANSKISNTLLDISDLLLLPFKIVFNLFKKL